MAVYLAVNIQKLRFSEVSVLLAFITRYRWLTGQSPYNTDSKSGAFIAKIHPQLPLNPRESNKLVRMLRTSFRRQLDEAHPVGFSRVDTPINDHFHPILSSPLFVHSLPIEVGQRDRTNTGQSGNSPAMEQFKLAVAAGTADLKMARHSLSKECKWLRHLADKRGLDLSVLMKASGAGSLVRSWLWSSGRENLMGFLQSKQSTRALVTFLVAEGQETVPFRWLKSLSLRFSRARRESTSPEIPNYEARMLHDLVFAHRQVGSGIGAALQVFLDYFKHKELHVSSMEQGDFLNFRSAGAFLVRALAQGRRMAVPDIDTYELFQQTVDMWARQPWESHIFKASLLLYHPIKADESLAWHYMQRLALYGVGELIPIERRDTITLLLDATETLLSKGSHVRAAWVATFLQTCFAAELGIKEAIPKQVALIEEDTFYIKSLEALVPH